MPPIWELIAEREAAANAAVEQLREQISKLSGELAAAGGGGFNELGELGASEDIPDPDQMPFFFLTFVCGCEPVAFPSYRQGVHRAFTLIRQIAASADGSLLATVDRERVLVWNAIGKSRHVNRPRLVLTHLDLVEAVAPNGSWIATGSGRTVRIWHADHGSLRTKFVHKAPFALLSTIDGPPCRRTAPGWRRRISLTVTGRSTSGTPKHEKSGGRGSPATWIR